MKSLLAAVAFLTRLPVGRLVSFDAADVARSAGWFPLIGALLGTVCALAAALLRDRLPLTVVAVVMVALDVLLTGALHFDAFADVADGFGGGKDREDVLRIMRDHCIGSYGGTALVLLIDLKVSAYHALLGQSDWLRAAILTPALGRWSMLLLTGTLPYARPSLSVVKGMGKVAVFLGTLGMAALLFALRLPQAWIAAAAAAAVTAAFGLYCRSRIGGITGDTLGANLQLCESAALLAFLWMGRP